MPKNTKGGKNFKKRGKEAPLPTVLREKQEENEQYGTVEKLLGDCKVQVKCEDGESRLCKIPGSFYKKVWINLDDAVLISVREFEPQKGDILTKYDSDEVRQLKKMGVVFQKESLSGEIEEETEFDFDDI